MSHVEQLVWHRSKYDHGEHQVVLLIDGRWAGRVAIEALDEGRGGLHYSLNPEWQGKGFGSMMVDMAFAKWPGRKDWLLFVDDPDYKRLRGGGGHTREGKLFAVAYRRKRGLDRPVAPYPQPSDQDYDYDDMEEAA